MADLTRAIQADILEDVAQWSKMKGGCSVDVSRAFGDPDRRDSGKPRSMPFSANERAYSGKLSVLSQCAMSCIAALRPAHFRASGPAGRALDIDRRAKPPQRSAAGVTRWAP